MWGDDSTALGIHRTMGELSSKSAFRKVQLKLPRTPFYARFDARTGYYSSS